MSTIVDKIPRQYVDEDGNIIRTYDDAENIKYNNRLSRLQSDNVQDAITELANEVTSGNSSSSGETTSNAGGAYRIIASEWGITKCDSLPERGKHYLQSREMLSLIGNNDAYFEENNIHPTLTYEDMHNNALGIERAIEHAYRIGYSHVILEKGIYYFIPENMTGRFSTRGYPSLDAYNADDSSHSNAIKYTYRTVLNYHCAAINIFNKYGLTVDFGASTLCFIVDSAPISNATISCHNPYYVSAYGSKNIINLNGEIINITDETEPLQTFRVSGGLITVAASTNIELKNCILYGDSYTRSFIDANEAYQEATSGISTGYLTYNLKVSGIDGSGFMGDAISTGIESRCTLRDYRQQIYQPINVPAVINQNNIGTIEEELIDNVNYGLYHSGFNLHKELGGSAEVSRAVLSPIQPTLRHTRYVTRNGNLVPEISTHFNTAMMWYRGPGFINTQTGIGYLSEECAYSIVSEFVNMNKDNLTILDDNRKGEATAGVTGNPYVYWDEYKGRLLNYKDIEQVNKVINDRMFTVRSSTGSTVYWPKIYILTYASNEIKVFYNHIEYTYKIDIDEVYQGNTKILKTAKNGADFIYAEVLKIIYNFFNTYIEVRANVNNEPVSYYVKYNAAIISWKNSSNVTVTENNVPSAIKTKATQILNQFIPVRVIEKSNTGDFTLNADEHYIRIQCFYDKGLYGEPTISTVNSTLFPTFNNTMFTGVMGELQAPTGYTKAHAVTILAAANRKLIVDNCIIHDNFRGGIVGGIKDLTVTNCTFWKTRRTDYSYVIDEHGQIPRFRSSTNYAIDVEECFTSNIEIAHCRFLDNNSVLVLSGMNFNFHDNICYNLVLVRNVLNTTIRNNVFYRGMLSLDWWKLGSGLEVEKDADSSQETIDIASSVYSDGIGNIPGGRDKLNLGSNMMFRHINILNNTCYDFSIPYRYFWKTVFNIHGNTLYLDLTTNSWKVNNAVFLDHIIEAAKWSRTSNNLFIINNPYFSSGKFGSNWITGPKVTIPIFGASSNNVIESRGGDPQNIAVAPFGDSINNTIHNGCIRLGVVNSVSSVGSSDQGVNLFRGYTFNQPTTIKLTLGDPATKVCVRDCIFKDTISYYIAYYEYFKEFTNRPGAPTINIVEGTDSSSSERQVYFTLAEDSHMSDTYKEMRRLYYSTDDNHFIRIEENETITLYSDTIITAIVCIESSSNIFKNLASPYACRVIYVNHGTLEEEGVVYVQADDEQVNKNWNEGYPESKTWTRRDLTLDFIDCEFNRLPSIPARTGTASSNPNLLTINFKYCDFYNVEDNCIVKVKGVITGTESEGVYTYSGLQANKLYYDSDRDIFALAKNATTLDEAYLVRVKVNNCKTNENFVIYKVD